MNRFNTVFAVVFACILLVGCASSGQKISQSSIDQIEVGQTSKEQMMDIFGPPLSQSYGSEGNLTMLWSYVHVGPFGTGMRQQTLAVLFDDNGKVKKYNLVDNNNAGVRLGN